MRVEVWAKHHGVKARCYWERFGEQIGNLEKLMGTYRVHDGNKGKKQKIPPHFFAEREKLDPS
jgi:hypothetical protein